MNEQEAKQAVSPAIIEAQTRLLALRARRPRSLATQATSLHDGRTAQIKNELSSPSNVTACAFHQAIAELPEHLGWGSRSLSKAVRRAHDNSQRREENGECESDSWLKSLQTLQPPTPTTELTHTAVDQRAKNARIKTGDAQTALTAADVSTGTIKIHPDIALGILRNKMAAPGRIWLILRWIDKSGSGQIEIAKARKLMCDQESAVRVCGWRQLRSLIAQGQGIFWNQRNGRLWLLSTPKVARALGTERLSCLPVAIPVKTLTQGIGQVRAHLFASFHSGRKQASPISRATMTRISQVSPRSQQTYEKRARVRKLRNFAVGPKLTNDNAQDQAWQHGSACFRWHDSKTTHGPQKSSHLAWQLPNSYSGPHEQRPRGRQKQFNRELAVLFTKGITGNDQFAIEMQPKRYFDLARNAVRTQEDSQTGVYWRGRTPGLWYFMEYAGQL